MAAEVFGSLMAKLAPLAFLLLLACDVSPDDTRSPLPVPADSGGAAHECSPLDPYSCGPGSVCVPIEGAFDCAESGGLSQGYPCELDSDCRHGMLCAYNAPPGVVGSDVCSVACSLSTGAPCPGQCYDLAFDPVASDLGVGYCAQ